MGSLARGSAYLEVDNIYSTATAFPTDLGGTTTKMVTDGNGAISGYFLLPRTDAIKFKVGQKIFTLLDISAFNPENATTIAEFIYESTGILQDIDQDILETRVVQFASLSSQLPAIQTGSYSNDDGDDGSSGKPWQNPTYPDSPHEDMGQQISLTFQDDANSFEDL